MPITKSYAQTKGKRPFDWEEFILSPEFSIQSLEAAQNKARSWVTCACGQQCSIIPRADSGVPMDDVLEELGAEFLIKIGDIKRAYRVLVGRVGLPLTQSNRLNGHHQFMLSQMEALDTLIQIEERSAYLIKQIHANAQD